MADKAGKIMIALLEVKMKMLYVMTNADSPTCE